MNTVFGQCVFELKADYKTKHCKSSKAYYKNNKNQPKGSEYQPKILEQWFAKNIGDTV